MAEIFALLVLMGLMTPISCAAIVGTEILTVLLSARPLSDLHAISCLTTAVIAVAVAFIGPGAFSIDSRLFGRREIVIKSGYPHDENRQGS